MEQPWRQCHLTYISFSIAQTRFHVLSFVPPPTSQTSAIFFSCPPCLACFRCRILTTFDSVVLRFHSLCKFGCQKQSHYSVVIFDSVSSTLLLLSSFLPFFFFFFFSLKNVDFLDSYCWVSVSLLVTKIMGSDYFSCLVSWIFWDIKSASLVWVFSLFLICLFEWKDCIFFAYFPLNLKLEMNIQNVWLFCLVFT